MPQPWLVTGLSGTLAPHVADVLRAQGQEVVGWDRHAVPADASPQARAHLEALDPAGILHLAIGSEAWAGLLAQHAARRALPLVFTSTAMVFHHEPDGPHRPGDSTTAQDGYGQLKARTEEVIRAAHPGAVVARIGWQMHPGGGGNNMFRHLGEQQAAQGHIRASRLWVPACSFMTDTAAAVVALALDGTRGTVHLDSNADDALTFPELVRALAARHSLPWTVVETDDYRHDQRLADDVRRVPGLRERLALA